jgi:hypothetical protein
MTVTKKKVTTKKKQTTSSRVAPYQLITLPQADVKDFRVIIEAVNTPAFDRGYDFQYGIINKHTGVIEMRSSQLTPAIIMMQSMQQMYDKMISGEMHGFGAVAAAEAGVEIGELE